MMQDFFYEESRESVTDSFTYHHAESDLADKLGEDRLSYRIYYSKDRLTRRTFIFRAHCNESERSIMLGAGYKIAQPGDTENF